MFIVYNSNIGCVWVGIWYLLEVLIIQYQTYLSYCYNWYLMLYRYSSHDYFH